MKKKTGTALDKSIRHWEENLTKAKPGALQLRDYPSRR